jgi:phosphohistidine swiveling domain-containing protein
MSQMIRGLDELTAEQHALAGGKGGTLARLRQAGFPVPDGFLILPTAFDGEELKPEAWEQVQANLARLRKEVGEASFAVRSSALSEDSAQDSFAGEFETVLEVHADEMIRQAIQAVRRSRHSERVRVYSQARGLDQLSEMAVIVQRMVRAHLSGVLFTADPVSGSHNRMTGNYVHGLGDELVSGEVTPFAFSLSRPKGGYEGPMELRRFARHLFKLAKRLETELGGPQDIEWAVAGKRVYVLQSRPITTLQGFNPGTGEFNDSLTGDYLWSSVNFGEAVTEPMTPLAWSVLQFTLDDWVFLPGYATTGNIGGRPYLNISVFASLFQALRRSRQDLLATMEGTLYMRLPEEMAIPLIPLSSWGLISALPKLARMQIRHRQGVRSLRDYTATNPEWCRQMKEKIRAQASAAGLFTLWRDAIKPHLKRGVWTVLGTVNHSTGYTLRLRRDLTGLAGPQDANLLIANLSADDALLPSLGPVVGLAKVAGGAMKREAYLAQYGHRGPHEFEISVPRPAEDPDWLDRQLARFRESPVDVEALLAAQRERFEAVWQRFLARYPRKAKAVHHRIAESARRARLREQARSEYVRDRWLVRAFALRAAELTGLGDDVFYLVLDELLDLLSGSGSVVHDISARRRTHQRYKALPSYPPIIRGRFDPFQWAADPERRSDLFDAYAPLPTVFFGEEGADLIVGSPGAAGRVEGLVRRVDKPEDGDQLRQGEVLVTMQTDIAWTLLFPRAAAIVTDVGAPLSHASIVARELGIPAVVGCGDATMRLKTGARVRVDGGQGTVEILETGQSDNARTHQMSNAHPNQI